MIATSQLQEIICWLGPVNLIISEVYSVFYNEVCTVTTIYDIPYIRFCLQFQEKSSTSELWQLAAWKLILIMEMYLLSDIQLKHFLNATLQTATSK